MDSTLHLDVTGFARAGAIAAGLAITTAGYSTGVIAQRFASHKGIKTGIPGDIIQSMPSKGMQIK